MTEPIERRMHTAPLTITVAEFVCQVLGARTLDAYVWPALRQEEAIVQQYLYGENSITYIDRRKRYISANLADLEARIARRAREVGGKRGIKC